MSDSQFIVPFKKEIFRKLIHSSGVLFLLPGEVYKTFSMILLGFFILIYFLSQYLEKKSGKGILILAALTHLLERKKDQIDPAPPLLALGILFSLAFFPFQVATCGILQICIGDSIACLMGKKFGKSRIFYSPEKTWLGSFFFFLATFLIQLPFISPIHSLIIAFIGTFLESLPMKALDNFVVPIGVAIFYQRFLS